MQSGSGVDGGGFPSQTRAGYNGELLMGVVSFPGTGSQGLIMIVIIKIVVTQTSAYYSYGSGLMVRTSGCFSIGLNPLAAVSKLGQFCSIHVASVHSAVLMSTWL